MVQLLIGIVCTRKMSHDAEDSEGREQVGEEIEKHRADGLRADARSERGDNAEHQVASVRDTGKADEALHVVLGKRGDVAKNNGGASHD